MRISLRPPAVDRPSRGLLTVALRRRRDERRSAQVRRWGSPRGTATLATPARVHHISADESPPTPAPRVAVADHRTHDGVHIFAVEEDPLPELKVHQQPESIAMPSPARAMLGGEVLEEGA